MSVKTGITIDNLRPEDYQRYAQDQAELDHRLIDASRTFTPPIEGGLSPLPALADSRFNVGPSLRWATFAAPIGDLTRFTRLFSHQLIPSLGGSMDIQDLVDRAEALLKLQDPDTDPAKQIQKMVDFLKFLHGSSETYDRIKSCCYQFQKG